MAEGNNQTQMSIRDRIAKAFGFATILNAWDVVKQLGKPRPTDYLSLIERYRSWVYVCAQHNAATVANVPLRLYTKVSTQRFSTRALSEKQYIHLSKGGVLNISSDVREITEHPLLDLMQTGNWYQTGMELLELTVLFEELCGNAYWFIENGALGVPANIHPLLPQYTRIVADPDKFIAGYLYGRYYTNFETFEPEEVIHFRYTNPGDLYYGWSPLQAALSATDRSNSMGEYEQALYDNNARPDFIIKVPDGTTADERKRLYEEWSRRFEGKRKAGHFAIMVGDQDVKELSFSPRDANMLEHAKYNREEIANIFGLPMTMLEVSASRAEAEANLYAYMLHSIQPRLKRLETKINRELVPRFDPRLFVAFDNPVPENRELDMQEMTARIRAQVTCPNEERTTLGLPPAAWGDEPVQTGGGFGGGFNEPPPPKAHICSHTKALPPMTEKEKTFATEIQKVLQKQGRRVLTRIREVE